MLTHHKTMDLENKHCKVQTMSLAVGFMALRLTTIWWFSVIRISAKNCMENTRIYT